MCYCVSFGRILENDIPGLDGLICTDQCECDQIQDIRRIFAKKTGNNSTPSDQQGLNEKKVQLVKPGAMNNAVTEFLRRWNNSGYSKVELDQEVNFIKHFLSLPHNNYMGFNVLRFRRTQLGNEETYPLETNFVALVGDGIESAEKHFKNETLEKVTSVGEQANKEYLDQQTAKGKEITPEVTDEAVKVREKAAEEVLDAEYSKKPSSSGIKVFSPVLCVANGIGDSLDTSGRITSFIKNNSSFLTFSMIDPLMPYVFARTPSISIADVKGHYGGFPLQHVFVKEEAQASQK